MTAIPAVSRLRALADLYVHSAKNGILVELQHRAAHLLRLVGFLIEPVVYLVVWSVVLEAGGGSLGGYTAGTLAAYYLVWTLVRTMNMVFTPYGFGERIRTGLFSSRLLRPLHPIHYDLSYFAGGKVVQIIMWLPIGAALALIFRPTLSPRLTEIAVFCVALWGAYVLRSILMWLLGLVTFWTTRVAALFELYVLCELLLSGRLVPLSFLPEPVGRVADWLPFKWTFAFPIEALIGQLDGRGLLTGLLTQFAWIAASAGLLALVWRRAVRNYTAVGN